MTTLRIGSSPSPVAIVLLISLLQLFQQQWLLPSGNLERTNSNLFVLSTTEVGGSYYSDHRHKQELTQDEVPSDDRKPDQSSGHFRHKNFLRSNSAEHHNSETAQGEIDPLEHINQEENDEEIQAKFVEHELDEESEFLYEEDSYYDDSLDEVGSDPDYETEIHTGADLKLGRKRKLKAGKNYKAGKAGKATAGRYYNYRYNPWPQQPPRYGYGSRNNSYRWTYTGRNYRSPYIILTPVVPPGQLQAGFPAGGQQPLPGQVVPTKPPTNSPTLPPVPTFDPTRAPTRTPTLQPTPNPTRTPTLFPTRNPTRRPTRRPTRTPTRNPTRRPTRTPTRNPTRNPTRKPTPKPTQNPTRNPTQKPTPNPTPRPTPNPTPDPTPRPTPAPAASP
jgi:hypothetical protein